jgi:DNA-binding MarR family transcriptional regulator
MEFEDFGIDPASRESLMLAWPRMLILAGEMAVRAGDALIFEPAGLNVARYSLLVTLQQLATPHSMTQLKDSNYILRSPSNLTQMVDDLEARGLVHRIHSRADRRVQLVEITEEGNRLVNEATEQYFRVMAEFAREYSVTELRAALALMIRWVDDTAEPAGMAHLRPTVSNARGPKRS